MSFITPRRVRGSSFAIGGRFFASSPSARRSSTIALGIGVFMSTEAGGRPTGAEALPADAAGPGAPGSALAVGPGAEDETGAAGPSWAGAAPPVAPPQATLATTRSTAPRAACVHVPPRVRAALGLKTSRSS